MAIVSRYPEPGLILPYIKRLTPWNVHIVEYESSSWYTSVS